MTGDRTPNEDLDVVAAVGQIAAVAEEGSFRLMLGLYAAAVVLAFFDVPLAIALGLIASWMRISMMLSARVATRLFL